MKPMYMLFLAAILLCLAPAAVAEDFFQFTNILTEVEVEQEEPHFYVAPDGDDGNPGTLEAPVATLTQGLILAASMDTSETVTVWMRGGEYYFEETIHLYGNMGKPIAVRAYPGETPVLTGAKGVEGWSEAEYMGRTVWSATFEAEEVRALYGENGARQISRWPKTGWLTVKAPAEKAADKFANHSTFYVETQEVPVSMVGTTLRLLHWWKDELSGVAAYDPLGGLVTLNRPTAMSVETGDMFWLENVLTVSLSPGEWAFDTVTRTLYYAPMDGETLENTRLYAGVTEQLLNMTGVSELTFDGLTFTRTAWSIPYGDTRTDFPQAAYDAGSTIYVYGARDIAFTNCDFRDIGAGCIRLDANVKNATIYNCAFRDIGAQAVYIHGVNTQYSEQKTETITVENNLVSGYGRNFYNAVAILVVHARDVDINHNEIHDGTYTAISAGWVWGDGYSVTESIRIRNNLVYDIGQGMLSDMGGIYLLGRQAFTVVTGNIVHDVTTADYGGWGIYLDEGASGITVSNNLVYGCSAQGFHVHLSENNRVENNIFAYNLDGQVGGSGAGSFTLSRNLIVGSKPYFNRPDTVKIKQESNVLRTDGSVFVDAANGNYNVINDEALAESGFVPWVYQAGRYSAAAPSDILQ